MDIDEALICADDEWESTSVERTLAAEVRRLREELAEWKSAAGVAGLTVGVLKEENDRLKYATPVNPSDVTNT